MIPSVHFEYVAEMSAWNKILGKILDRDVHLRYSIRVLKTQPRFSSIHVHVHSTWPMAFRDPFNLLIYDVIAVKEYF